MGIANGAVSGRAHVEAERHADDQQNKCRRDVQPIDFCHAFPPVYWRILLRHMKEGSMSKRGPWTFHHLLATLGMDLRAREDEMKKAIFAIMALAASAGVGYAAGGAEGSGISTLNPKAFKYT